MDALTSFFVQSCKFILQLTEYSLFISFQGTTSVCHVILINQSGVNPLTPELNPSVQRCLTRFFAGDFAS
jgi:hypothetical protein